MATSKQLQKNKLQHKPKNDKSKQDEKNVAEAMKQVVSYINKRFNLKNLGYYIEYNKSIKLADLISIIKSYDKRFEFANLTTEVAEIKPDGGILILRKTGDRSYKRIILVVEVKKQGTNKERIEMGKKKQARGNAIERLGKNLIGIRATLQYEDITPFVCFGWGDDFEDGSSINDRVITMNEFYPLNRIFVFKRENYAPVSMFFREERWDTKELYEIMKEIAETSIRYYIF